MALAICTIVKQWQQQYNSTYIRTVQLPFQLPDQRLDNKQGTSMKNIAENLNLIYERITAAAHRARRDPAEVTLIAVSKAQPLEAIQQAIAAGVQHLGENKVQEAEQKINQLSTTSPTSESQPVTWHLIGHLQRNKARTATRLFGMVQSLDSVRLAETLNQRVSAANDGEEPPPLPVLLQVNVSGEVQKEGFDVPGGVENQVRLSYFAHEVEQILALPHLRVHGLMTIAPLSADPHTIRPVFRQLRLLRDAVARQFPATDWSHLSMGMTNDFEVAIEEGATLVRVGRAIFGERLHKM